MSENDNSFSQSGQRLALEWMSHYLRHPRKVSEIREGDAEKSGGEAAARRARRLHSACLRHLRLYREMYGPFTRRAPQPAVEAGLLLALAEVDLQGLARAPLVIDSWVGGVRQVLGPKPAGFLNAVLRRASIELQNVREGTRSLPLPLLFSHPDWLVEHWISTFGPTQTRRLLEWNQSSPSVYASSPDGPGEDPGLETTPWPGFQRLSAGINPVLAEKLRSGDITIRDPATRIAVDLLCASRPRNALDLCASPGGKSRALLSRPDGPETVVAADLEKRLGKLRENLAPWKGRAEIRAVDLQTLDGCPREWNENFDAVLLDAPCSNTGVIQRKPDVKWRLTPADLQQMPPIQLRFLQNAARFVRPGGVLVYSTCSLERAENREVADGFLRSPEGTGFEMTAAISALPFKTGHDGAGGYRFIRTKDR